MAKLLRLQAVYARVRGGSTGDDAVTTHDFIINDSTWPDAGGGLTHNYATMEGDFLNDFWGALCVGAAPGGGTSATAAIIGSGCTLKELRWYREDDGVPPFGDAARITTPSVTSPLGGAITPPQVACTVTELTDSRRHWGRFYIPGIAAQQLNADGSLKTTAVTFVSGRAKALYDKWNTRGVTCIVLGTTPVTSGSIRGTTLSNLTFGYSVTKV